MADLNAVFGGGDNGLAGANPHTSSQTFNLESYNQGPSDNNQYTHPGSGMTFNGGPNQNAVGTSNNQVKKQIQKLKEQVEQKKAIKELKEELEGFKSNESIIDKYVKRKGDLLNYLAMAMLFVLGLTLHDFIKTYLNKYLINNDIEYRQELMLRLAVPLTVFFVLWTLKAFNKNQKAELFKSK